jgi:hypothetical protein
MTGFPTDEGGAKDGDSLKEEDRVEYGGCAKDEGCTKADGWRDVGLSAKTQGHAKRPHNFGLWYSMMGTTGDSHQSHVGVAGDRDSSNWAARMVRRTRSRPSCLPDLGRHLVLRRRTCGSSLYSFRRCAS